MYRNKKQLTLEASNRNVGNIRKELFLGIFIIVTLTSDTDTNTVVDVLNTTRPERLVQSGVKTNVLGTHGLFSESLDSFNGMRSTLSQRSTQSLVLISLFFFIFYLPAKDVLVQVNGVFTSNDISKSRTLLRSRLGHVGYIKEKMDGWMDG